MEMVTNEAEPAAEAAQADAAVGQWGRWTWSDIGKGRWHQVVAVVDGVVEAHDGLVPRKAAVTACGRVRILPDVLAAEADESEGEAHAACKRLGGRLRIGDRVKVVGLVVQAVQADEAEAEQAAEPVH
jgi:hypothetical protein